MSYNQIIVVDDDVEDQIILLEYFKETGTEKFVKFLSNGKEAIKYLEKVADNNSLPHLIVLDLNMPILNGTQTLIQVKRDMRYKDIPIIIFSTSENESEKRKCLSMGALEYLVKPTTYDEGVKMIEKFNSYINQ
jgi:CheY-like chemotaxis protein